MRGLFSGAVRFGDLDVTCAPGSWSTIKLVAHRAGHVAWECELVVTDGDGLLYAGMAVPEVRAGHLFASTDGEHAKGGTSHQPQLHCVGPAGTHCWSRPWRVLGALAEHEGELLALCWIPGDPPFEARRVRVSDGEVLETIPIEWPPELRAVPFRWFQAGLVEDGGVAVRVTGRTEQAFEWTWRLPLR